MSWQPLLQGDLGDRAQESVRAIVDDLAQTGDGADGFSLADGSAGLAILHGYLARGRPGSDHAGIAHCLLRCAVSRVAARPGLASLYSGLTGVGWAIGHL